MEVTLFWLQACPAQPVKQMQLPGEIEEQRPWPLQLTSSRHSVAQAGP